MPTSVGPKTYGKDNLVFGYDTGDTKNSYKGEPTENLVDAFPGTSLPSGFHLTYEFSASIHDAPVSNHEFSNKKWIKFTKTKATNGRVMFTNGSFTSGSQYTWSCYVYCNDSRLTALYHGSDNGAYSQRTSFKQYDFNKLGTVQRLYGTWNQLQNAGSVFGMRAGSTNPLSSSFFMTGLQVEEKGHMTPVIDGERSVSGSLLDTVGDRSLNLTNVTFRSGSDLIFDGTNDRIPLGQDLGFTSASFSVEAVIKWDGGSTDTFFGYYDTVTSGNQRSIHWRIYSSGQVRFDFYANSINSAAGAIVADKWYHLLVTYDYYSDTCKCYRNGELLMQGSAGPYIGNDSDSQGYVGSWTPSSQPFGGEVPVCRIYNRALTAGEVKSNYAGVKKRYNIE